MIATHERDDSLGGPARPISVAVHNGRGERDRSIHEGLAKRCGAPMKPFACLAAVMLVGACAEPPPPLKMASVSVTDQHAECPRDSTVVGGGYEIAADRRAPGKIPIVVANRPTETGWMVQCVEPDGQPSKACKSYVLCATVLH